MKDSDILSNIKTGDRAFRIEFYQQLGFNLTISIRSVGSDPWTTEMEKLEAINTINELLHRIFKWLLKLQDMADELSDTDSFSVIREYAEENKVAGGEIGRALRSSYETVIRE